VVAPCLLSSRRRHTTFSRDWSSDVCSSDLSGESAYSAKLTVTLPRSDVASFMGWLDRRHPLKTRATSELDPSARAAAARRERAEIGRASCRGGEKESRAAEAQQDKSETAQS